MSAGILLADAIQQRRSIRRFQDRPVTHEVLLRLIDAARHAPSAGNRQDWFFTIVLSASVKAQMAEAVERCWDKIVEQNRGSGATEEVERYVRNFTECGAAPGVVAVTCRSVDVFQRQMLAERAPFVGGAYASSAMASQNLMLAAHAEGLGSCCMTGPVAAEEEILALLGLGQKHRLVCLVALGYPAETPTAPPRKPVEEIMRIIE